MAKVTNIGGTADNKCKCGSWLKHWERGTGTAKTYCSELGCWNTDIEGAHVQKANSTDQRWWIVPLCGEHNRKSAGTLDIGTTELFSANKSLTCEKED